MTITITRLDFTHTVDLLVTAACRHAKHAQPGTAVALYDIATDLNEVAKKNRTTRPGGATQQQTPPPPMPSPSTKRTPASMARSCSSSPTATAASPTKTSLSR